MCHRHSASEGQWPGNGCRSPAPATYGKGLDRLASHWPTTLALGWVFHSPGRKKKAKSEVRQKWFFSDCFMCQDLPPTLQSNLHSLPSWASMSPGAWRKWGRKKRSWGWSLSTSCMRALTLKNTNGWAQTHTSTRITVCLSWGAWQYFSVNINTQRDSSADPTTQSVLLTSENE